MLLSVTNLDVAYGAITALHDVSLDIDLGEIVALIGSNGAGKTTLLRTISGLITPQGGSIQFNGPKGARELTRQPSHEIVCGGLCQVPEGRQIFANLTVRENLALGAYQRRDKDAVRADLDHCYALFPVLAERRDQRAGT